MTAASKGSTMLRWGRAKIVELFGADLRSLAAFRIVLALLVLADLANRLSDLFAHYADAGVLPRTALVEEVLNRWSFSLNLMNGGTFFQALLVGVGALAALALLVGYRTRLASIVVWVVVLSIQWRNPLVLSGGDVLLRVLLFWAMFLPLGAYWSVDRALKAPSPSLSMRFLSLATVGLFMQIAFVYWFTAIQKSGPEWRVDYDAIYYALSVDQLITPIGAYLSQFPTFLEVLTAATMGLEAFGPFLLFCPIFTRLVRFATVLAFVSLHFGIWLAMDIGLFPWIAAFCMVCFLPGQFWDKADGLVRGTLSKHPDFVRRVQRAAARPMHAYWSPLRRRFDVATAGQPSVVGLVADGNDDQRESPAASASGLDMQNNEVAAGPTTPPAPTASAPAPAGPSVEASRLRSSLVTNILALFFLLYVFLWNLTTVSSFAMPERLVPLGLFLGLNQSWDMFAPYPTKDDGWYVIPGTLRGGQQVDLMAVTRDDFRVNEGVSWEKPRYVAETYKNEHWRKYLERIRLEEHVDQRVHFGRYICREWNARHTEDETLETFQIVYMLEMTPPDYELATPEQELVWEHTCF